MHCHFLTPMTLGKSFLSPLLYNGDASAIRLVQELKALALSKRSVNARVCLPRPRRCLYLNKVTLHCSNAHHLGP